MNKLITIDQVTTGYNKEAILSHISMEVYRDDFIGVIGPNGGGKTTLLKLIIGEIKPYKGAIRFHQPSLRIGYLPQFTGFDKMFPISAREVIESGLPFRVSIRPSSARRSDLIEKVVERTGTADILESQLGILSGGQVQKVLLARAMVSSPQLLILDEPGTFVDNAFEGEFYNTLRGFNEEAAILLVSHDVGMISSYVKSIACVNRKLHYHPSNIITQEQLANYDCPIKLITHGDVPHTVMKKHD